VFGHLLNGAQPHLGKLRKERPGAYNRLSRSLESIMDALGDFPRTLTVQDQALFSLGYYHQRAEDRRARREAAEKKRAGETVDGVDTIKDEEDEED
jgi:CRISPR-associated protein Csd1